MDGRPAVHRTVEAVWRLESARIVASLTRLVRDLGLAEDLAQDALVEAMEQWPRVGVPPNPAAWLMLAARHRAIDRLRRDDVLRRKVVELGHDADERQRSAAFNGVADFEAVLDAEPIDDDVLRLLFLTCHPVLPRQSQVALALRLFGGLGTAEIARAWLSTEVAVGQRITRAKRTLAERRVEFALPPAAERPVRLGAVLETVYLIFNEGYTASAGDDLLRPQLSQEALRLGRILAGLVPEEPEVHGLVALMEIQASRERARVGPDGEPIPLHEQNRGRWDQLLIRRGFEALLRARELDRPLGPYVLQAAIAACHARARSAEETDWPAIAALYETLGRIAPSPVVELNRAVAVAMAFGPAEGLRLVDALAGEPVLAGYHRLPSVRGDLLARLGRDEEARAEFRRAAQLATNARERAVLERRAQA